MGFDWLVRRQKKVLFVLAIILMVAWGGGMTLMNVLTRRGGVPVDVVAHILGEPVKVGEYQRFAWRWSRLFPMLLEPDRSGKTETEKEQAYEEARQRLWAYLAAARLADRMGIEASSAEILTWKNNLYAQAYGRPGLTIVAGSPEYQRWQEVLGLNGSEIDVTVGEFIKANIIMGEILAGVKPTRLGAFRHYLDTNREYRLEYVEVPDTEFLKGVVMPSPEEVQEYYDEHRQPRGPYWREGTYEIEYAGVLLEKLESRVKVTAQEIQEYYEQTKDLYRETPEALKPLDTELQPADNETVSLPVTPVRYRPLAEVKQQVEQALKRVHTRMLADSLKDRLLEAVKTQESEDLEKAVRTVNDAAVVYERPGPLTDRQLLDLKGIGDAMLDGRYFHTLVMSADPSQRTLSQVLSAPGSGLYVFRVLGTKPGAIEPLDKVRERVIDDMKRARAAEAAGKRIESIREAVAATEGGFREVVRKEKLAVQETPMFVNNLRDSRAPGFVLGTTLSKDRDVYVMRDEGKRRWVLAHVKETREATPEGFKDVVGSMLAGVTMRKQAAFGRSFFPKGLLDYVDFKMVEHRRPAAPLEPIEPDF